MKLFAETPVHPTQVQLEQDLEIQQARAIHPHFYVKNELLPHLQHEGGCYPVELQHKARSIDIQEWNDMGTNNLVHVAKSCHISVDHL